MSSADDFPATASTPGTVPIGGATAGTIEVNNDSDWLAVQLLAGTTYVFDLNGAASGGGTLTNPYLKLYAADGGLLELTSRGGQNGDPRLGFTPTASGKYFLAAESNGGNTTGTYTLHATISATADDFPATASTPGTVPIGGATAGTIEVNNDSDWLAVQLLAGTTYVFDLNGAASGGGTLTNPYLKLYAADGGLLELTSRGGQNGDPRLGFTPTASGKYFLAAESNGGNTTGTYTLHATISATADDFPATASTPGTVPIGGATAGTIEVNNDSDWLAVQLLAGTTYVFDLNGAASGGGTLTNPYLKLYAADGGLLELTSRGGQNGDPRLGFTPTASGKYFLAAESNGGNTTGTYTLHATISATADDFPATASTPGTVPIGGATAGTIEVNNDSDWLAVQLLAGTTYVFDLNGAASGGGTLTNPYLKLYAADGGLLELTSRGGQNGDPRLGFTPTASGKYFLAAESNGGNTTGTYTLHATISATADDFPATASTPGTVPIGGATAGTIEVNNDSDWLAVQLLAGTTYVFDLNGAASGGGTLTNPYLKLYAADGGLLELTSRGGQNGDPRLGFTPTASGKYFLAAESNGGNTTGTYTLHATISATADDFPATASTPGTVPIGGATAGTIEVNNDSDWLAVQLLAGTTYVFDLNGAASGGGTLTNPYLKLYAADGGLLELTSRGGQNGDPRLGFTPTASGKYFLAAESNGGNTTGTYTLHATISASLGQLLSVAATKDDQAEGDSATTDFTFVVTRTGDLSSNCSVNWAVAGFGAASADATDFTGGTLPFGTVTFAPSETSKTITVVVVGDTIIELDEGFTVGLFNPAAGASLGNAAATGIIRNDDHGPSFSITRDGAASQEEPLAYSGPVLYLQYQFLGGGDTEVVVGTPLNDFINLLGGDDAASGAAGDDVLDGGIGSNFLTGGTGWDVFFLDGRSGAVTWATITDWQSGEQLSVWGWRPGVSRATWVERAGAAGWEGATMHGDLNGDGAIDTSVTWSGAGRDALPAPIELEGLLWFR